MSCGNPVTEPDALMPRTCSQARHIVDPNSMICLGRPRYDKSKLCVKCKVMRGNLVIRHAVYCKCALFSRFSFLLTLTMLQRLLLSARDIQVPESIGTLCQCKARWTSPYCAQTDRRSTYRIFWWTWINRTSGSGTSLLRFARRVSSTCGWWQRSSKERSRMEEGHCLLR